MVRKMEESGTVAVLISKNLLQNLKVCLLWFNLFVWFFIPQRNKPFLPIGAIRLFPINRLENYEDEEDEYVSRSTKGLCYTLGALYCILGLFSLIAVVSAFFLFCFFFFFFFFFAFFFALFF